MSVHMSNIEPSKGGERWIACLCALLFPVLSMLTIEPAHAENPLWVKQQAPFKIFGNTYYVGTRGLSSVLVTSNDGHVLIDGTLPQNAGAIAANVRSLGFKIEDVKLILNSHAHSDHAGAIAELQRLSGAAVVSSAAGAAALRAGRGGKDDPQFEYGDSFPPVPAAQAVSDGETLHPNGAAITAHYTPGHTPGAMSWSWKSCEKERCLKLVYADSLNAVSDDSFKFTGGARYPSVLKDFEQSFRTVEALPCDILIAAHPEFADLWSHFERQQAGIADAFVDTSSCRSYAAAARKRLEQRVTQERTVAE